MDAAPATPRELPAVRGLLRACGLPVEDVGREGQRFLVACEDGRVVGCIGLEVEGTAGLLRSFAVDPACRGRGVGGLLHRGALDLARSLGVRELYVLTTTVEELARRWGFEEVDRGEVPEAIRAGDQFRSLCPATAACLRLRLG